MEEGRAAEGAAEGDTEGREEDDAGIAGVDAAAATPEAELAASLAAVAIAAACDAAAAATDPGIGAAGFTIMRVLTTVIGCSRARTTKLVAGIRKKLGTDKGREQGKTEQKKGKRTHRMRGELR